MASLEEGSAKIGGFFYGVAGTCAFAGCVISFYSMLLHLKNYRRPDLQRMTLRIMLMYVFCERVFFGTEVVRVPIYAIASFVSLSSRYLSDYIDMVRDLYELNQEQKAFVIYTFFTLLVNYMGGERELIASLVDKPRTPHIWPLNLFLPPVDMSDPHTFLWIRRGVLQFAVLKPILSILSVLFKISGVYHEGYVAWNSVYLWISLGYNASCSGDLREYRPFPKFVCVKAIIFFSFWQGLALSFLVWAGVVKGKEEKYSANNIALALQDLLILLEIVPLAFLHWHAFPWEDYDDSRLSSRIALPHAIRDVFGIKDILQDYYHTLYGTTFHFQSEEQRRRRQQAYRYRGRGYQYSSGPNAEAREGLLEDDEDGSGGFGGGRAKSEGSGLVKDRVPREGYGTLYGAPSSSSSSAGGGAVGGYSASSSSASFGGVGGEGWKGVEFGDPEDDPDLEVMFESARRMVYGDSNFPVISTDPRFANPPIVQRFIDRQAGAWERRVGGESVVGGNNGTKVQDNGTRSASDNNM
ncbi:hypothetical protein HDU97_005249 [Phlyctochytrium planicorne]|nr:hypothetical protein HDU97_005249 [Phlyctochytrium planicorne]